jgi:hypothetical protein
MAVADAAIFGLGFGPSFAVWFEPAQSRHCRGAAEPGPSLVLPRVALVEAAIAVAVAAVVAGQRRRGERRARHHSARS